MKELIVVSKLAIWVVLFFSANVFAATVRDEFNAQQYNNNDGTQNWATSWVEGGSSSDTSPTTGFIQVINNRLELEGVNGPDPNISRTVDLGAASQATLTFDLSTSNNLETTDQWAVEVASSPTGTFRRLETFVGNTSGFRTYDISAEASTTTTVRFRVLFNVIGGGERVHFDNITIDFPGANDADLSLELSSTSINAAYQQSPEVFLTLNNDGQSTAGTVSFSQTIPDGFDFALADASVISGNATLAYNGGNRRLTVTATNVPVGDGVVVVRSTPTARARGERTILAEIQASTQNDPDSAPSNDDGDQSEDDEDSLTLNPPDFSAVCIPPNPQAHWPFDASTNDATANGHNQTGGATGFSTNEFLLGTGAASLAANQRVIYNDGQFLNYRFEEMSISLFIKPNSLVGTQYIWDEGGAVNGVSIRLDGATLQFAVREGSTTQQTLSAAYPTDSAWHHITATYDNGIFEGYLDGISIGSINTGFGLLNDHGDAGGVGAAGSPTAFGSGSGTSSIAGLVDHVSYYNRVLSPTEIRDTALCGLGLQPTIVKSFTPSIITAGNETTLRFIVTNNNPGNANNIQFTDSMPPAMWLDSLNIGGSCAGFTFGNGTAPGDSNFTLSGGNLAGGQSCTLDLSVRSNVPGNHSNQTGPVLSSNFGEGEPSNTASLTVSDPGTSVCTPASTGAGAILMNYENDIYSVDLLTAKANLITSVPGVTNINALATDPRNYLIYYTDNNSVSNNLALLAYDILNDTHFTIDSDLTDNGVRVAGSGLGSSGNTFYNGSLYIGVEDLDLAFRVVLSDDGRSVRYATEILQLPAAHDFGDFVAANGKLYDFDRGADRFKRYDLATLTLELDVPAPFATQGGAQRNGDSLWSVGDNLSTVSATTGALDGNFNQPITIDGTTPIPGTPFDAAGCVVTTSRVGDLIWNDTNGDGVKDSAESGIGNVTVALYWDLNGNGQIDSGENDIRDTAVTAADGSYNFDLLIPGDYVVRVTDTNNVLGAATTTNNGGSNDRAFTGAINSQISDIDFGYQSFIVIEGSVFNDNGTAGGTAHNAIKEAGESGFENVAIQVTNPNNNNALVASGLTDADGFYRIRVANSFAGQPLDLSTTTSSGFISISENTGNTGATNADPRDDLIQLTPVASSTYQNVNFGDVRRNVFEPNNSRAVQPGLFVDHAHSFTAGSLGVVNFTSMGTASPAISSWQHAVYRDTDCSGNLSSVEVSAGPVGETSQINVSANDKLCLVVRVFAPNSLPVSARYVVDLQANFSYINETPDGLTETLTVSDLTTVASAGLSLTKLVENRTLNGPQTDANQALPGHELRYSIAFVNNSAGPIDQVNVKDSTPAYTTLSAPVLCPASLPAAITACTVVLPTAPNNSAGYEGAIEWQFTGNLNPGQSGSLQYDVVIQ